MSYASNPRDLKKKARESIKNREPGKVLPYKKNTRKAALARDVRADEWTDFEEKRKRITTNRQDIVDNLPDYHKKLREKWAEHGVIVHEAPDASSAREEILKIVKDVERKKDNGEPVRVLKSKSMLSEEIEINGFLEKNRVNPVETDLGEYIVQLRKEAPSHITMPGMHLDRYDVGKLFAEKLNVPYTHDPTELTKIARKVLREEFLKADVGMIGVNFAVAQTGHIATVTNEGNGRMVSSMPKVVIALMGYERVTQNLDELAILWQMLARSATGQKATVYLNLMYGPSPGPTGPGEVHIVVVDNGRKKILADKKVNEVLLCIRCGACLNACPVYQQIGGHPYGGTYPGPIGKVITPLLEGLDKAKDHAFTSTLCGACEDICPVSIPIPDLLLELRKRTIEEGYGKSLEKQMWKGFTRTMEDEGSYNRAAKLGTIVQRVTGDLAAPSAWSKTRKVPKLKKKSFRDEFKSRDEG